MQQLPLDPRLYFCLLVLGVVYTVGRCIQYAKFRQEIDNRQSKEGDDLSISRDWWIVRKLRQRAFVLHTGTHLLLFGMFTLLLGGIYLVLFILPWVQINDQILIEQQRQRGVFEERFSERLKLISEGLYWFRVLDLDLGTPSNSLPLIQNISNADGISITLAVGRERVAISMDNGGSWTKSLELDLNAGEWVRGAVMDGGNGVLWGGEGSVFVIQQIDDDLQNVKQKLDLNDGERIRGAVMDGGNGVLWGDEGSVFVIEQTADGLQIVKQELDLKDGERVEGAVMDGGNGVLWGDRGSVFAIEQTADGLQIVKQKLDLKDGEWVEGAVVDSGNGGLWGDRGSVFVIEQTADGLQFVKQKLDLKDGERIREAVMDSGNGVLWGGRGSVFVIEQTADGLQFVKQKLDWNDDGEWVEGAVMDSGGGVLWGDEGSVFVIEQTADGLQFVKQKLDLKDGEWVERAVMDSGNGVLWGGRGSVFVIEQTADGLQNVKGELDLNAGEWVRGAVMDGGNGVLWGDRGSVLATRDNGNNWIPTIMDQPHGYVLNVVSLPSNGILAIDEMGKVHTLNAYSELANAANKSPAEVRDIINKAPKELIDSTIGQNIVQFSDTRLSTESSGGTSGNNLFGNDDLKLTVMRVATLTILLFLAQMLVRLIQYSLRLAATWNSQADAMLISQAPRQDEFVRLISALTPIVEFGNAAKKSVRHSREE